MQKISDFKKSILDGIPKEIPIKNDYDTSLNRAPIRKKILNSNEKN